MGLFSGLGTALGTFVGGPLGASIGGAIGSAIDGRSRGGNTTTSRTNFKQLRDDAEAAGFNPLTALRSTGGAGNVTTITNPILGSKKLIGDIIGGGISAAIDFDPFEKERQNKREDLQDQLLAAELQRIQAETGKLKNTMFPPKAVKFGFDENGNPLRDKVNLRIDVFDDKTGRTSSIINPDITESGPVETVTGLTMIGGADLVQNGFPALRGSLGFPASGVPLSKQVVSVTSTPLSAFNKLVDAISGSDVFSSFRFNN